MATIVTEDGAQVDPTTVDLFGGSIDPRRFRRLLIVHLYARGWSIADLADLFGVSRRTVYYELQRIEPEVGERVLSLA